MVSVLGILALSLFACGGGGPAQSNSAPSAESQAGAVGGAAPANQQFSGDCRFVTNSEAQSIMGLALTPTEDADVGCVYDSGQSARAGVSYYETSALEDHFAADVTTFSDPEITPGATVEPVSGVGDEAVRVRSDSVTYLFIKRGGGYFTVIVGGLDDSRNTQAADALGSLAVSRL
jgi:hypothetical protein